MDIGAHRAVQTRSKAQRTCGVASGGVASLNPGGLASDCLLADEAGFAVGSGVATEPVWLKLREGCRGIAPGPTLRDRALRGGVR
jgi:hypothetical protein